MEQVEDACDTELPDVSNAHICIADAAISSIARAVPGVLALIV
jgi:hypothetical protein